MEDFEKSITAWGVLRVVWKLFKIPNPDNSARMREIRAGFDLPDFDGSPSIVAESSARALLQTSTKLNQALYIASMQRVARLDKILPDVAYLQRSLLYRPEYKSSCLK